MKQAITTVIKYIEDAVFGELVVYRLANGEQVEVVETSYGYLTIKKAA